MPIAARQRGWRGLSAQGPGDVAPPNTNAYPAAAAGQKASVTLSTPFYGYPARLIAEVLGVGLRTAKRYKAGGAVPRPALRLWSLYTARRILPDDWLFNDRTRELVSLVHNEVYPLEHLPALLYRLAELRARLREAATLDDATPTAVHSSSPHL